jgi:hypothetical protein
MSLWRRALFVADADASGQRHRDTDGNSLRDLIRIERSGALERSSFLIRRFNAVFANEIRNNPFQPHISYRGDTASLLPGTPQGLSVYMDDVTPELGGRSSGDVVECYGRALSGIP